MSIIPPYDIDKEMDLMRDVSDKSKPKLVSCMIKRSKFVLLSVFDYHFIKTILLTLVIFTIVSTPLIYINGIIATSLLSIINIDMHSIIGTLIEIIALFLVIPEMLVIGACLSCFPRFNRVADKVLDWCIE